MHKSGEDANVIEIDRDQGNGPIPEEPELGLVTSYSAPQGGEVSVHMYRTIKLCVHRLYKFTSRHCSTSEHATYSLPCV